MKVNEESKITFSMDGVAESTFQKNRIGLCVLHPLSAIGDSVLVTHSNGSTTQGSFPEFISPHQPFKDIRSICHTLADGDEVEILLTGDRFEMEDQRNWSDGSFKTYSTPLEDPFPIEVASGTHFRQSVTIRSFDKPSSRGWSPSEPHRNTKPRVEERPSHRGSRDQQITMFTFPPPAIGAEGLRRLPNLGLCCKVDTDLSDQDCELVADLNLAFLRMEFATSDTRIAAQLESGAKLSEQIGVPAEIVFRLDDNANEALACLIRHIDQIHPRICAFTVLTDGQPTTRAEHLVIARRWLAKTARDIPIGGGSQVFFAELNRFPPPVELLDFCVYPVTPQVHATDERSIVETLPGQSATVESALHLFSGKPVHVEPITLKPRLNSNAQMDERQSSLFAAAWTVGSIASLARSGAHSAAYYEILGNSGVMAHDASSPLDALPARQAEAVVYPVYFVFKAFGEMAGSSIVYLPSNNPKIAEAFLLRTDDRSRLFVVNYSDIRIRIEIAALPSGGTFHALDATSFMKARSPGGLILQSNGVCWIDWRSSQT